MKEFRIATTKSEYERIKIKSVTDAVSYLRNFYRDDISIYESFFILLLDSSNHTLGYAKISQGGVVGTVVDTRIIAKYAIDSLATGIILCHNHPSGNLRPSVADRDITRKIAEGLKLFDVKMLDHIILTAGSYSSFTELGYL